MIISFLSGGIKPLNAFAEVDNALASYRNLEEEYRQRHIQVKAAAKALVLSQALYDNGYTSYLEVIVMETNLFDAQLLESTAMQEKLNSIVALYKHWAVAGIDLLTIFIYGI